MAAKKDNLPQTMDNDTEQTSSITYATEVIAIIAGVAANEVEGIAGMCNISSGILGRNRNITKGVKVEVGTEEVSCDLYVIIEYGRPIQKVAQEAQEGVRKAIESMTGMRVVRVDVHVQGVSFEKENSALTAGAQKAKLFAGEAKPAEQTAPKTEEADQAAPKAEEQTAPVVEFVEDEEVPAVEESAAEEEAPAAEETAEEAPVTEDAPAEEEAAEEQPEEKTEE